MVTGGVPYKPEVYAKMKVDLLDVPPSEAIVIDDISRFRKEAETRGYITVNSLRAGSPLNLLGG